MASSLGAWAITNKMLSSDRMWGMMNNQKNEIGAELRANSIVLSRNLITGTLSVFSSGFKPLGS